MQYLPGDLAQLKTDEEAIRRRQQMAQAFQQAGFNPVSGGNQILTLLTSLASTLRGNSMMKDAGKSLSENLAKQFEAENEAAQAKAEAERAKRDEDYQRELEKQTHAAQVAAQYREKGNIDPNSPEGIAARLQFERAKVGMQPKTGQAKPDWQSKLDAARAMGIDLSADDLKQLVTGLKSDTKGAGDTSQAKLAYENSISNLDRLGSLASQISQGPLERITGVYGALPDAPGSGAADLRAQLDTLKSQVGFGALQAMRDASKTGGALGAISERELAMLQNNLAALDTKQSPESFRKSLKQIQDYAEGVKTRQKQAFYSDFGQPSVPQGGLPPSQAPNPAQGQPTQTATNPQTGQRIGLINGQWVPI